MDGQEVQVSVMMDYESCLDCGKKNRPGAERRNIQGAAGNETLYLCHWSHAKRLCLGSACQRHSALSNFFSVSRMVIDLLTLTLTPRLLSRAEPSLLPHSSSRLLPSRYLSYIIQESHFNSAQNNGFMLLHNVAGAEAGGKSIAGYAGTCR